MIYAMVGIPLGLVMFQSIGERLNKFASVIIRRFKIFMKFSHTEATEINLMAATGFLSSLIILTGAAVFSRYEGWSYFDSFYYCFVTLTTIGFGDYVALQNDKALINNPGYVALSLVFILFGLAIVAASINLLVLRFMTMNAEDIRIENEEAQKKDMKVQVMTMGYEHGEHPPPSNSGNAGGGFEQEASMRKLISTTSDCDERASACSCNCMGNSSGTENGQLLIDGYLPTDLITDLTIKRASV